MTDTPSIPPALTADEWTELLRTDNLELVGCDADEIAENLERRIVNAASWHADYERYHKAAAVCLYGQPFGFTQEDVALLRMLARDAQGALGEDVERIAQRIAALLPPT